MSSKIVHYCKECKANYITVSKGKKCLFCGSDKIKIKKVVKMGNAYAYTV
jgi:Zn finger protein HypA/HybF involved in hydrogenase expression